MSVVVYSPEEGEPQVAVVRNDDPSSEFSTVRRSREVLERVVEAFGDDVLETVIGRTVKFPDASVSGVPITTFAPEHAAAQAYLRLARELVARGAVA